MSSVLRLADKARQGLSALPFEVQEAAIDLMDDLTTEARIRSRPRQASRDEVFELDIRSSGKQFVVWLVARFDHHAREVVIDSIGHVSRD